ncbi:hypothetical protein [Microvirga sp. 2TAF3]
MSLIDIFAWIAFFALVVITIAVLAAGPDPALCRSSRPARKFACRPERE